MRGTVAETAHLSSEKPDDNMVVKMLGDSAWTGTPGKVALRIARSKLGSGDEIALRFAAPMTGKLVVKSTLRSGAVMDTSEAGPNIFMTLLEQDAVDPAKRVFQRDYNIAPTLGAVPTDPFARQISGHQNQLKAGRRNPVDRDAHA